MSGTVSAQEIAERLLRADRILILTHEKPDGDAFGSALGFQSFLRSCGRNADALFPAPLPRRFSGFASDFLTTLTPAEIRAAYDLVLLLDCANPARIGAGAEFNPAFLSTFEFLNVDHHQGNCIEGAFNLVDPSAAAASQLAAEIALASGREIRQEAATFWLFGIVTDTGSFRFSNTDGRAMRIAAELLDRGADLERIVNAVYFSKPRNQQEFEADLLQNHVRSAFGGKFVYARLPDELFRRHGFDMRDGEGIIDLLREIDGSVIAALIYSWNGVQKVSLRSKDAAYPVGPLARSLGGGGHAMAAGITLESDPEQVERLLLEQVGTLLKKQMN